jgi:hypothetical protein
MSKPNVNFTVKQMKDYIRKNKLNHPAIKLSMRRAELIEGLKKAGHWNSSKDTSPKKKPSKQPTGQWNPLESENAPMNKWVSCTVFNLEGKNPKPYECRYVYQTFMYNKGVADDERPKAYVVWIKDGKGNIIAAGDMGHLNEDSKKRVTQFRFSNEVITISVDMSDKDDVGDSGGLNRILTNNEKHRLIENQPKQIQNYYKKPQYKSEIGMGDFVYDIVRKIKFKKDGNWRGKLKPLTTIPKMLYRK